MELPDEAVTEAATAAAPGGSAGDRPAGDPLARPPLDGPDLAAEALDRFTAAGYRHRFELAGDRLRCPDCGAAAHPADFAVEASVRLAGSGSGATAGALYALECLFCGVKGTWHVATAGPAERAAIARLRDGRPHSGAPRRH